MYDVRDYGTYLVMLLVLPLFAVVFGITLLILTPLFAAKWLHDTLERRTGRRSRPTH